MRQSPPTRSVAAAVLLALCAAGPRPASGANDARVEALRLYAEGRYQEALPALDEALRRKPRDVECLNKRGCVLIRMNQPARAIPDFDAAVRYNPFLAYDAIDSARQVIPGVQFNPPARLVALTQLYPSALTNRGIAYLMLGRDEEALADFRRSIAVRQASPEHLGPNAAKWRAGMAAAYCGLGQVEHRRGGDAAAVAAYDSALAYDPTDPNARVGRGVALAALGRLDEAVACYDEALRLDPSHARAYGYRAVALERLGRDEAAVADYDAAVRVEPGSTVLRRTRGALLSKLGHNEAAVADLDEAVRLAPADANAYKDRGGVYNRLGRPALALADLDRALALDPANSRAYQNRAAANTDLGRYEAAVRDCDQALRLEPDNAGALNNRGRALAALGRYGRAVDDLTESIRLNPDQIAAWHNRAGALARLGRLDEAAADYGEVVRRAPGFAPALAGVAQVAELRRIRGHSGRDDLALRHDAGESRRYRDLGNARRSVGDYRGAAAEFSRALESDPGDTDALALRAWALACSGDAGAEADARAWLDRKGWRDPLAPSVALLGVVAARRAGDDAAAAAFLDEALANTHPPGWPSPVFRYLKRTASSTALLAAADTPGRQAEANAVVGLDLLERGERAAAGEHLRRAVGYGAGGGAVVDLAREALRRLTAAPPSP